MQPSLLDVQPTFDGPGLTAEDHPKLSADLARVLSLLENGAAWTLEDLAHFAKVDRGSIGSRVRDLRKGKFGGFDIRREPTGIPRLWAYRLVR